MKIKELLTKLNQKPTRKLKIVLEVLSYVGLLILFLGFVIRLI